MIQFTRAVAIVFVAGGFGAIGMGWNGMARVTCVDCQLPYLLSGGVAGLGLIVLGAALLVIAQIRAERVRILSALDRPTGEDAPPDPDRMPTEELGVDDREPETAGASRRS